MLPGEEPLSGAIGLSALAGLSATCEKLLAGSSSVEREMLSHPSFEVYGLASRFLWWCWWTDMDLHVKSSEDLKLKGAF